MCPACPALQGRCSSASTHTYINIQWRESTARGLTCLCMGLKLFSSSSWFIRKGQLRSQNLHAAPMPMRLVPGATQLCQVASITRPGRAHHMGIAWGRGSRCMGITQVTQGGGARASSRRCPSRTFPRPRCRGPVSGRRCSWTAPQPPATQQGQRFCWSPFSHS